MRWRVQIASDGGIVSSPAVAPDGTIYIGNWLWPGQSPVPGTSLYSISPLGTTNWIFGAPGGFSSSPALSPDGIIYVGSINGTLYALNSGGTTNWAFPTPGKLFASPALGADGAIYINPVSNRFNSLFALNPDGTKRWVVSLGAVSFLDQSSAQFSSPAVGPDGTIYAGSMDQRLYAINRNGTTNWTFPLHAQPHSSPSVGLDGTVYIGADTNVFYAINNRGVEKWRFTNGYLVEASAAINKDGNIIIGSLDGFTYAVSPGGTKLWKYQSGEVSASPAIASDGSIYVADLSHLRALNSSGSNLWSFAATSGQPIFSSPAIGPDGTIYIAIDQYLYAFYGSAPVMESSWPMFRRNADHRARSLQCAISAPAVLVDGSFGMSLTTEQGLTYRVQASSDFVIWTELTNFLSSNFGMSFTDPDTTNFARRFYRLATP